MHKNTSLFKRFVALAISLLMVLQMMPVASLAEGLEGYSSVSSDPYGGNEYARVTFRSPGKEEDEYDTVASRDIEIGAALGGLPDVPDGDGYLCTWKAEDGTQVTKDTVIQSNMVVTASLYKEYTFEDQKLSMVIRAPKGRLTEEATPYLQSVALTDEQMAAVVTKAGEDISVLDAINVYFQNKDGEKVQPDQSVSISMHLKTAPTGNVSVVHIPDAPVATRKLMKATKSSSSSSSINAEVVPSSINGQDITFDAGSFSVYAVVESGSTVDEARVTVNFYGTNMTTPVATYYVKNSDVLLGNGERQPNVQYIEDIVIDPGVGATLESNKLFLGWSIDAADANNDANYDTTNYGASYSTNTKHYTVDEIRQYLANKVIRESEVLNIYGMIFNVFTVQYEDPFGVILAEDEVIFSLNETSASYAISQSYSAPDQTHNFEGWNVKTGSTSISNATFNGSAIEAPYPMGTTMTIAGSIVFSVNMSEGHWLIFEENGNNATYNAPIFIKQNEVSREPSLPMVRPGYSFDGWWTGKPAAEGEDPTGSRYTFGQMLEDTTTLYAKWNVDETATYSIIIWVQSVSDDKDAADALL